MNKISFQLVYEDEPTKAVVKKIIETEFSKKAEIRSYYGGKGKGYISKNVKAFYKNASKYNPVVIVVDLDVCECAPLLLKEWSISRDNVHFIFRVVIREIESWLLADRHSFAKFFKVPIDKIPLYPEQLPDPKQSLINIMRKSKDKTFRKSIVPEKDSRALVGKSYNSPLIAFINSTWEHANAFPKTFFIFSSSIPRPLLASTNPIIFIVRNRAPSLVDSSFVHT